MATCIRHDNFRDVSKFLKCTAAVAACDSNNSMYLNFDYNNVKEMRFQHLPVGKTVINS